MEKVLTETSNREELPAGFGHYKLGFDMNR